MGNKKSRYLQKYLEQIKEEYPSFNETQMMIIKKAWRDGNKYGFKENPPEVKKHHPPTEKLVNDMKILYGIPPHDVGSNICMNDGYFANDLRERINKLGCDWDEVLWVAKKEGRKIKPSWDR